MAARTKTDAELEALANAHENDPPRAEALRRARRFKNSWIELAEVLTDVRKSRDWQRWGYDSFEQYCKSELHLRQETVDKLTGSFLFLKKKAPEVLERDGVHASIPSYQSIDFLRRAEDRAAGKKEKRRNVDEEESEADDDGVVDDAPPPPREMVAEIRKRVLEDNVPMTVINKEYRDAVFPIDAEKKKARDVAGLKNVATRLRELLGETRVLSRALSTELSGALDRALEALAEAEEKAA